MNIVHRRTAVMVETPSLFQKLHIALFLVFLWFRLVREEKEGFVVQQPASFQAARYPFRLEKIFAEFYRLVYRTGTHYTPPPFLKIILYQREGKKEYYFPKPFLPLSKFFKLFFPINLYSFQGTLYTPGVLCDKNALI